MRLPYRSHRIGVRADRQPIEYLRPDRSPALSAIGRFRAAMLAGHHQHQAGTH
jgi:hypothetical protein